MAASDEPTPQDEVLGRILNEYLDRQAGPEPLSETALLRQYPQHAAELRQHFDVLRGLPISYSVDQSLPEFPGYTLIREIHRGGQGVVYEAIQHSTRRTVAVKVLLDGSFANEQARWRFEREVRLVASLDHQNIVTIHDSGIVQGHYFFAMDYVRGEPLDTHVRIKLSNVREIVPLFRQVCEAVAYAHGRGVIHRDLKPSNILISEGGCPCILDFGLAKVTGSDILLSQDGMATMPGNVMGTLPYMAPEQTFGDSGQVDVRTDVYALGVIFYELLTGQAPYWTGGEDIAKSFKNIREVEPLRPSVIRRETKSELDAIVMKAVEKEPGRRYQTASQFADDLAALMDGRPVSARSASSLYVLRKLAVRHGFESIIIGALLLSIIAFAVISFQFYRGEAEAILALTEVKNRVLERNTLLESQFTSAMRAVDQQALGWFLLEWRTGRLDSARSIYAHTPQDTPEAVAMSFLLDPSATLPEYLAKVPETAASLIYYVAAERAAREGNTKASVTFLHQAQGLPAGIWKGSADALFSALMTASAPAPAPLKVEAGDLP